MNFKSSANLKVVLIGFCYFRQASADVLLGQPPDKDWYN